MRMVLNTRFTTVAVATLALIAVSCSGIEDSPGSDGVTVVATTTILGDIARNVVGEGGSVEVILPIGADPHDFNPSSAQVAAIYSADVVVANGLGLEGGLVDVLDAAVGDGVNVIEVAMDASPVSFLDRSSCSVVSECDPHGWLDPIRAVELSGIVAEALSEVDQGGAWTEQAATYSAELVAADRAIAEVLAGIPMSDRVIVTNHDSLGYFADRYGFNVVGTVFPGGSTHSEPSSSDLAELVRTIERTGVSTIFVETTEPAALAEVVADEVGKQVSVVTLYTGSLGGPGSGAETLIDMLLVNARRIADALS